MKALIQRVSEAQVSVEGLIVGAIGKGLLLFLGIEKNDGLATAEALLNKVMAYRVFKDNAGKMNLSLNDIGGELLVISQFTLLADTNKGLRPSFANAADPLQSKMIYEHFVAKAQKTDLTVATGVFGADMKVGLVNDGPVTFNLSVI